MKVIDAWVDLSAERLAPTRAAVHCVVNPEAIYIGGRLPTMIVDRLNHALDQRLRGVAVPRPPIRSRGCRVPIA